MHKTSIVKQKEIYITGGNNFHEFNNNINLICIHLTNKGTIFILIYKVMLICKINNGRHSDEKQSIF